MLPRPDRAYSEREKRLFARLPWLMRLYRWSLFARLEARALVFTVFPVLSRLIGWLGRRHIRRSISNPRLRARLTPDYPAGCKRILLANDYYPAFLRENVHLHTEGIRRITPRGVTGADGRETAVDAIVLATGFRATDPVPPGMFLGRGGIDLTRRWREGMEAFQGMSVSGFPNLFLLMGPNTGLGHNSVVFMIEAQVRYVLDCLRTMTREGVAEFEVRREVETAFNEGLQRRLRRTVWVRGCRSWYQDARGRIPTLWPGFTLTYWFRTRRFRTTDYSLVRGPLPPRPRPFSPAGEKGVIPLSPGERGKG